MMEHIIRMAMPSDSGAILKIYAPYIKNTAVSFETEIPSAAEFARRIEGIIEKYPYLVYQIDGEIAGYAYASEHRERSAYLYDIDVSIYVSPQYHGTGAAYKLYDCLFTVLKELGYYNAYAAYTVPNEKSRRFHEKFGFTLIGTHHKTGYKFGKWHDVVWLEKTISDHIETPGALKSMTDLPKKIFHSI